MKLVASKTSRDYSWTNEHNYYVCNESEYDLLYNKYINNQTSDNIDAWIGDIYSQKQVIVIDGYAQCGGYNIKGKGITIKYRRGTLNFDISKFEHYFCSNCSNSIEKCKNTEFWV